MPFFFWIGFWLLGLLPVFQRPIKAGTNSGNALKFAKVPGRMRSPGTLPKSRGASEQIPRFKKSISLERLFPCLKFCSLAPFDFGKVPGNPVHPGTLANLPTVPGARPGGQNAPRTPGAPGAPWLPGAPRTPWSQDTNSPQDTRSPKKHPGPQYPRLLVCLPGFQPPTKVGTNLGGVVRFTKKYPKPALERRTLPFFRWASGHSCPTRFPVPQHNGSKFGLFF